MNALIAMLRLAADAIEQGERRIADLEKYRSIVIDSLDRRVANVERDAHHDHAHEHQDVLGRTVR